MGVDNSKHNEAADVPAMSPEAMKALANPLRRRIMRLLTLNGHGRATDLAAELGITSNLASFHLRTLAAAGLVEEAPELKRDGRDRVWRPASGPFSIVGKTAQEDQDLTLEVVAELVSDHQALLGRLVESATRYVRGESRSADSMLVSIGVRGTRQQLEDLISTFVAAADQISNTASRDDPEVKDWELSVVAAQEMLPGNPPRSE